MEEWEEYYASLYLPSSTIPDAQNGGIDRNMDGESDARKVRDGALEKDSAAHDVEQKVTDMEHRMKIIEERLNEMDARVKILTEE